MAGKTTTKKAIAKKSATKKRIGNALRSRKVVFIESVALAAALAGNQLFPDEQGTFEDFQVCLAGGELTAPLPTKVACVGSLVIYSSWAEVVPNCAGFKGPGAGNNAIAARALKNALAAAANIPCAGDCKKTVAEIWRGWSCGNKPLVATAAVEVKISCDIEHPN